MDNNLTILLTKTKPKRIAFLGNNGKRYMYLFKGIMAFVFPIWL
jgi:hypothetical protein